MHGGNGVDAETGAIRRPIVMANSYALPDDPSSINWSSTDTLLHTRNSGANQLYLQEKLAALEGGEQAAVLASGVASLHAVFFTFSRTGAHIVCSDVTYIAVYRLLSHYLPDKFGVQVSLVDTSDLDAVRAAVRPSTIVYVGGDDERAHLYPEPMARWGHLRLSVGLEDVDDLLRDLAEALADVHIAE